MEPPMILMLIFGAVVSLYGLYVYFARNPFIPKTYGRKPSKTEKRQVGRTTMLVGCVVMLSGFIVKLFGFGFWTVVDLITLLVLAFWLGIKGLDG